MGLDFTINEKKCPLCGNVNGGFSTNITHNLGRMAFEAGVYGCLWRPKERGWRTAGEIIPLLERGIRLMELLPEHFRLCAAKNGWGTYEQFLLWLKELLEACRENPDGEIEASV